MELNFSKKKLPKCLYCKKEKGLHQANTFNCPMGSKTRIGYISYHPNVKFEYKGDTK